MLKNTKASRKLDWLLWTGLKVGRTIQEYCLNFSSYTAVKYSKLFRTRCQMSQYCHLYVLEDKNKLL
jgi:hypothetical protein